MSRFSRGVEKKVYIKFADTNHSKGWEDPQQHTNPAKTNCEHAMKIIKIGRTKARFYTSLPVFHQFSMENLRSFLENFFPPPSDFWSIFGKPFNDMLVWLLGSSIRLSFLEEGGIIYSVPSTIYRARPQRWPSIFPPKKPQKIHLHRRTKACAYRLYVVIISGTRG